MEWEDFKKKGYYIPPVSYKEENKDPKTGLIEKWDEYPGFRWFAEERPCDTPNHKIFQEECKLGTLSGKFEFVSESLLYWEPDDEIRTPIAQYKDSWEGHKSMSADKYPYQMISPHPPVRLPHPLSAARHLAVGDPPEPEDRQRQPLPHLPHQPQDRPGQGHPRGGHRGAVQRPRHRAVLAPTSPAGSCPRPFTPTPPPASTTR